MATTPTTTIDARYGDPGAPATAWARARELLERAELYWLSTVRPDGRPHVTPLIGVWADDAFHFCTGADERKARNLDAHPHVVVTTGCNRWAEGLDVVVEGEAGRVRDHAALVRLAAAWEAKYGAEWHFDVGDGGFVAEHGEALVFRVAPMTAFGFGKDPHSQTRWTF